MDRYVEWFENLDPASLGDIGSILTDDVHFADPFNSVSGLTDTREVFSDMFRILESPRFRITHSAMTGDDSCAALLRWEMDATTKDNNKPIRIIGMSEIHFADDGRVRAHIDHWDAGRQFYEKLPLIGWLIKKIRSRMAA